MEELFVNKTKYSKEEYETFLNSYSDEYATSENAYIIFNIAFFGFCMVMAFRNNETLLGIALLIGLLIYIWFKFIRTAKQNKKDRESEKLSGNFVNTYKFYKNYFNVENPEGKAQILYFKLYRVVETNTNYYIYLSRDVAFIMSKEGFTKGNELEFSQFIKKKTFGKYKNRIKKNNK